MCLNRRMVMAMVERIMKTYLEGDSNTRIDLYMEHRDLRKTFDEIDLTPKMPKAFPPANAFEPFRSLAKRMQILFSVCSNCKKI
jgi:hypothetical protein